MTQLNDFLANFDLYRLLFLGFSVVASLYCITIHELCHGLAAYGLGDTTAKRQGRLTLNPIKHLDPLGFLMMLVAHVGWAKPVPVDVRQFKNPRAHLALTALAGPASNLVSAYVFLLISSLIYHLIERGILPLTTVMFYVLYFLAYLIVLNVGLAIFNLIPIPPLDGAKIFWSVLPEKVYYFMLNYERYVMILMLILAFSGVLSRPLNFCIQHVIEFLCGISGFPYGFFSYFYF